MPIFAISDLHLPLGENKPMDIFGGNWENYVEKLKDRWQQKVGKDDLVIMPGDFSWAMNLQGAKPDFEFLHSLNGIKLLSKGNHDYWWETLTKLNRFREENGFYDIHFLHNTAYLYKDTAVAVCRGWITPRDENFKKEDEIVYKREIIRLKMSIEKARELNPKKIIIAMHYPPFDEFYDIFLESGADFLVYGHLHGEGAWKNRIETEKVKLVSSDFLNFTPLYLAE